MRKPWAVLVFFASSSLMCASPAPPPRDPSEPALEIPSLLTRTAVEGEGPLLFPPPPGDGRRAREAMPTDFASRGGELEPRVIQPELDGEGAFDVTEDRFRIVFNHPMRLPDGAAAALAKKDGGVDAAPGTLRITPDLPGKARWVSPHALEFVAARPMTRGAPYTVELGAVKTTSGEALASGWKATMISRAVVAGKILSYVPMAGSHRVVAMHPWSDSTVGRFPELAVLYDQPIDLGVARALVRLDQHRGDAVPLRLGHPKTPSFQGVRVDPRFVVIATPATPLKHGEDYTLTAADRIPKDGAAPKTSSFTIASPLVLTDIDCDGSSDEVCAKKGDTLRMSGRRVAVHFNNRIRTPDASLKQGVTVTPAVRNLSVYAYGWDEGRVVLTGGFEPSKRYSVSVAGLRDVFGGALKAPVHFFVETAPTPASASMPDGVLTLDEARSKRFILASRNAAEAELALWPVPSGDAAAFERALERVRERELPPDPPGLVIPVPVRAVKDKLVETPVNLLEKLSAGASYVATVRVAKAAFGAEKLDPSESGSAGRPPVALLSPGDAKALAVHARALPGATLVHVARLSGGEPVAGATVEVAGQDRPVTAVTDASGVALLPGAPRGVLSARAGDAELKLDLTAQGATEKELFPSLAGGAEPSRGDLRGLVVTDRGIYRPGSTVWIKAFLRKAEGGRLAPVPSAEARVRIVGPTGEDALNMVVRTSDTGGAATSFAVPADAKLGRHQILIEEPNDPEPPIARSMVQVAEFEAPRFAVDVDAQAPNVERDARVSATVRGRYLFGAPMDGARVTWTLRREPAAMPSGPLTDKGFWFRSPPPAWYEEDEERERPWTRTGEATLGPDGVFKLEQAISMQGAVGPQAFTVEADVSDSSHRHVAGRASVTAHPASRYAGLRVKSRWIETGESVPVELGIIDTSGKPVADVPVTARLEHIDWRYVRRRGPGGSTRYEWSEQRAPAGKCSVKSASEPVACSLLLKQSGSYRITAEVAGRPGGSASVYAWRYAGDDAATTIPSRGRTIEIVTDKARYAPGETAKLLVHSPFPAATAILTTEQGGLLQHKAQRIEGAAAAFDLPIRPEHAPHVHAVVTLLPIGGKGAAIADYKVGAARLPVSLEAARLDVSVVSAKRSYAPGEEAEISIEVKDAGKPEPNAEITLAVVDEGVLRLTGFRPPDPAQALRPGRALSFRLRDSRSGLAELLEQSHVAGDGGEGGTITETRKNFVETALWRPDMRTDASGRAMVRFRLPDNLTQFRITAVALDDEGKGAAAEGDFTVTKPVMLVPVVPRFATVGDRFEAAAMLHNNTDRAMDLVASLGDRAQPVAVPARGKRRVPFSLEAAEAGEMRLAFEVSEANGPPLDAVEARLPVEVPGIDERPRVEGSFAKRQEIALSVPASARGRAGADALTIQVGQHLWPELGERLGYLMDYPHGCVEQTTSSTLPLLAARDIFPRIGFTRFGEAELRAKIRSGLDRLKTMQTPSGGLAYWPGGSEPNVYGTAYAMRAVVLAERGGIAPPKGLLEGMVSYLSSRLLSSSVEPEVKAAIAQSLAEIRMLPPASADALFDLREEQSVFGRASLALALAALPNQKDRVDALLGDIEGSFDKDGSLKVAPRSNDFYYYGSPERTRAQAAIALTRLRPRAAALPGLVRDLAAGTTSYTTQATAYSLLALAQQLAAPASGAASVRALLDGEELAVAKDLGFGSKEYRVPLARVRGKKAKLTLEGSGSDAVGFLVTAGYRRPAGEAESLSTTTSTIGPDVYRVFTDAKGAAVDLEAVRAGDVLRVALLVKMPSTIHSDRIGYVAVTDHLPAGFEPVQTDLATVASVPEIDDAHPLASLLRSSGNEASHLELHDDRVNVYFDRIWGDYVAASYVVRAVTPGTFIAPPASAELMYEPGSLGYTEPRRVVIQ